MTTIDEQILQAKRNIKSDLFYESECLDANKDILASLERIKRIDSVQVPDDQARRVHEVVSKLAETGLLLVKAQKDAERLDWLDTVQCGFDHIGYGDYRYYVHGKGYSKAREVIDAAIKELK